MSAQIKSILFLLAILGVWGYLIYTVWELQLFITVLPWIIPNQKLVNLRYSFWIWQDQGVNVLFLGKPDETVSSRVGMLFLKLSGTAIYVRAVIDWIFYIAIQQINHCVASIEWQEQSDEDQKLNPNYVPQE